MMIIINLSTPGCSPNHEGVHMHTTEDTDEVPRREKARHAAGPRVMFGAAAFQNQGQHPQAPGSGSIFLDLCISK